MYSLDSYEQGDNIGVLLDYEENIFSLVKNGVVHYSIKNIECSLRPAMSTLYFGDQMKIVCKPIPQFKVNEGKLCEDSGYESKDVSKSKEVDYVEKLNIYFKNFEWKK
jgi:hypothetical protein